MIAIVASAAWAQTSRPVDRHDLELVRQRLVRSLLPADTASAGRVHELASPYAEELRSDGSWSDIDYADKSRAAWKAAVHLQRTLVMAKSARLYRNGGQINAALETQTAKALRYWTGHDYQNPNWWWNQIGVPQLAGEVGCLLGPALPGDQAGKVIRIMQRGDWRHGKWTGGNLTWVVAIQIVRGCLQNDSTGIAESYQRLYQAIKIEGLHEEGIQPDFSFHQHGDQLYNGAYGLAYGNDVGRFVSYAWGTAFQIPAEKMKIFCSYLLDGQQWMMRGDAFDYSACGRVIVRPAAGERSKWTVGPIDPAGAAYGMPHVVALLAEETSPWQSALATLSRRLNAGRENVLSLHQLSGDAIAPLVGNRQFWCSDYMVHHRHAFFTSVKMLSNRMVNGETVNGEGKKSVHLSDGTNYLYLRGDEYRNIFPVWDWTKVPGTTAIQETLHLGGRNPVGQRGRSAFAGGVSDGTDGACAMDLERGRLTGRKAWFFFDDCYACLGSGITLAGDQFHSVATDVNQTLLRDSVIISPAAAAGDARGERTSVYPKPANPDALSEFHEDRSDIHWVYHNGVGYIFAPGQRIDLRAGNQAGRWSDIGTGSSDLVTLPVFNLWIDHGKSCRNATYQYVVLPGTSATQTAQWSQHPRLAILANDQMQAVYDPSLKLLEIVFRAPGFLATPLGRLQVSYACLLMARQTDQGLIITAANPTNQSLSLAISVDEKSMQLSLPGGDRAGSSVTASMPQVITHGQTTATKPQ